VFPIFLSVVASSYRGDQVLEDLFYFVCCFLVVAPTDRLKAFLPKNKKIDPKVLNTICRDYSARLLAVENEELAIQLYATAERSLQSVTRAFTRASDFIIDGVFSGATSSKASFYKAFDAGRPVVVKIYDDSSRADREHDMMIWITDPNKGGVSDLSSVHLVPVYKKSIRVRDPNPISVASMMKTAPLSVLVMPPYPCSVREFPQPVPDQHVLHIGECILQGLQHIWKCGLGFCDCKPDNIFLAMDGGAYLGDFGGMTSIGDSPTETTSAYIPSDLMPAVAGEMLDRWMLIITLLEINSKSLALPISRAEVVRIVNTIENQELKAFFAHLGSELLV